MALELAPFGVSLNSQFFCPTTKGQNAFSAALLEIFTSPCSKKTLRRNRKMTGASGSCTCSVGVTHYKVIWQYFAKVLYQ